MESNTKSPEIRRSCVFCRQRKMKCSGDLPCCQMCRQREKACIYMPVVAKTRSRPSESLSSEKAKTAKDVLLGNDNGQSDGQRRSNTLHGQQYLLDTASNHTIEDELAVRLSAVCKALANVRNSHASPIAAPPRLMDRQSALQSIARDLLDMTLQKMSQGTLCRRSASRLMLGLLADTSESLHDSMQSSYVPEDWMDVHSAPTIAQTEQMIELAFNNNPLIPLIVPKTPFMRDIRDGKPSQCLLWLVSAEGLESGIPFDVPDAARTYTLPSPVMLTKRCWQVLLRSQYKSRSQSIWIAQTLLLLGFRFLRQGSCKLALCVLLLNRRVIRTIVCEGGAEPRSEVKMNGMYISDVDEQVIANLFWLTYILLLWCWMQVDTYQGRLHHLLRPEASLLLAKPIEIFPRSPMYDMEFISGNLTSLHPLVSNSRLLAVLVQMTSLLRATSFGERHHYSHLSDCAAMCSELSEQAKQTTHGVHDELATKSILANAYVLSISLCDTTGCADVCDIGRNHLERLRLATDMVDSMLRECLTQTSSRSQCATLTHAFNLAQVVFGRIVSSAQASSVTNNTQDMERALFLLAKINKLSWFDLSFSLHTVSTNISPLRTSQSLGVAVDSIAVMPSLPSLFDSQKLPYTEWPASHGIRPRSSSDSMAVYAYDGITTHSDHHPISTSMPTESSNVQVPQQHHYIPPSLPVMGDSSALSLLTTNCEDESHLVAAPRQPPPFLFSSLLMPDSLDYHPSF